MKKLLFTAVAFFVLLSATAQTEEELKAQIAPKKILSLLSSRGSMRFKQN